MLNVAFFLAMLIVVRLSVIILSVIMLSVIMLSVVAPILLQGGNGRVVKPGTLAF